MIIREPLAKCPASDLSPSKCTYFEINKLHKFYHEKAPLLTKFIDTVCGIHTSKASESHDIDTEDAEDEGDVEDEWIDGNKNRTSLAKLNKRQITATAIVSQMLFARSQHANTFQTIMGYYLHANTTLKNAISCLNYVGLSIAYSTITKAATACGIRENSRAS